MEIDESNIEMDESTPNVNVLANLSLDEGHEYENDDDYTINTQWSLSDLPEVILVKVMEYLRLKDKYYLSVTCQRFYDLFNHPNLWKIAHIKMLEKSFGKHRSRWRNQSLMSVTMTEIVNRFSHLFQHLSLEMSYFVQPFDKTSLNLFEALSKECRLESLLLEVGLLDSKDEDIQRERTYYSDTRDVHLLTGLLSNATRLKKLKIVSWPLFDDARESNLFRAMLSNEKLKSLESLSLFYINKKQQWTGRVPRLPTPEQISEVVSFLPNLTNISLRSPMINDNIIQKLASEKRKCLEQLDVLIMWSRVSSVHDGFKIPEINDQSWGQLKMASPCLKVEFVIHVRIPFDELCEIFKPKVPLASITILKYGQCTGMLIDSVASKYGDSLTSFTSLCDSDDCDTALYNLVKECKNLNHLVYHGCINYKTVMQMATVLKENKREMKVFEFNERNVKTDDLTLESEDDDIVIRQDDETKEYVISGIQSWHYNEELHRKKLDTMVDHVRDVCGIWWSLYRI